MTFLWPWTFLGLMPVAAVAAWVLFRPRRQVAVVGTLALWRRALDALDTASRRRTRRVTAAWVALLAGAVAAVLAGARPEYHATAPARRVAVVVYPSAGLGERGPAEMRQAIAGLLGRLGANDRVQLVLPTVAGGAGKWSTVARARSRLAGLKLLPVAADDLRMPQASPEARHVYQFAVPAVAVPAGPRSGRIEIPTDLPPVTIDAVGAEPLSDGRTQLFVAVRNHTDVSWTVGLIVRDPTRRTPLGSLTPDYKLGPQDRRGVVLVLEAASGISVTVAAKGADRAAEAFLVRRDRRVRRVALIGRDDPYLRRLMKVNPMLVMTEDVKDADVVIANGVAPPSGKPTLAINPPRPPGGWRAAAAERESVLLADADVARDDEVMRGVDLTGTAVRRVRPWVRGDVPAGKLLVGHKGGALVVRDEPGAAGEAIRWVYVAFDIHEDNCTLVRTDAYVVFLANVMRYLAPGGKADVTYEYLTPLQAGHNPRWRPVRSDGAEWAAVKTLTPPGLYQDPTGTYHAVSLVGLRSGRAKVPPSEAAADLPLPEPTPLKAGMILWPVFLAAAVVLWLIGWTLRTLGA